MYSVTLNRLLSMRVAIYLRVSTDRQTTDSQAVELREYCSRRGWNHSRDFSDTASGAKSSRTGLDSLMKEVRRGHVDVIVAYKLDSWAVHLRIWPISSVKIVDYDDLVMRLL
jgi:DNA invertase Pin-like site-specific DNA recombinase